MVSKVVKVSKEEIFCLEYIKDFNGSRAARDSGWSKASAAQAASTMLRRPEIKEKVEALANERARKTMINAETVLVELWRQQQADINELFDDEGHMLPLADIPAHWARMITAIEVAEDTSMELDEDGKEFIKVTTRIIKYKLPDKTKLLEMIGKHVNVKAFVERMEDATNVEELAERLRLARNFRKNLVGPN